MTLVQGLIKDMSVVGGTVRNLPGQYPPEWEPTIRKAVELKRSDACFESARV